MPMLPPQVTLAALLARVSHPSVPLSAAAEGSLALRPTAQGDHHHNDHIDVASSHEDAHHAGRYTDHEHDDHDHDAPLQDHHDDTNDHDALDRGHCDSNNSHDPRR